MDGSLDPFPFVLAEKLGMSLEQVNELGMDELLQWQAFYVYRNAMSDMAAKEYKRG